MRKITHLRADFSDADLKRKIDAIIDETNRQKDEIRQIKTKTRATGSYSKI